jgi:hypothetical protein
VSQREVCQKNKILKTPFAILASSSTRQEKSDDESKTILV